MLLKDITYSDKRIEHFRNTYDTWVKNLPEDVKCILLEMLKHYQYYSLQEVNKYLTELHEKLNDEYAVSDLDSLHTYIQKKDGRHNSSVDYYSSYMNINGISSYAGTTNISLIPDVKWERIENIVIIDDWVHCRNFWEASRKILLEREYFTSQFMRWKMLYLILKISQKN